MTLEWIDINNKLPPKNERILTINDNNYIRILSLLDDNIWEDDYGYWDPKEEILYWMPLPTFDF